MSEAPNPLDPDQVECPRCEAKPSQPCRQPDGSKARGIHVDRRRLAAAGGTPPTPPRKRTAQVRNPNGPPMDARSRGGKASAQARRRRKAEISAHVEAQRAQAEADAIEREAAVLAADASRFARDRAMLRRHTLDAAVKAAERLIESLDGLAVVKLDDDGRPTTTPVERYDREGRGRMVEVPDVRGAYDAETVERLAKVAASTLNSLRLEEGKPTGITETNTGATAAALGETGIDKLLEYAAKNRHKLDGA